MPEDIEPVFLDAANAAKLISISAWTLYSWAKSGRIDAYAMPGSRALRFKREDLLAALKKREATPPAP